MAKVRHVTIMKFDAMKPEDFITAHWSNFSATIGLTRYRLSGPTV
jgi:hypothetical protein